MRTLLLLSFFFTGYANAQVHEMKVFRLFDGEKTKGRLSLPIKYEEIKTLVLFIPGTGPNTFINHREGGGYKFNYFDFFAEGFTKKGVAFFSYNRRGVDTINRPPFDSVDRVKFQKYLPKNEEKDVASIIKGLRKDKRLKNTKLILFGWSEGSIIAAMVADNPANKIDYLFLAGYVHLDMMSVIKWQFSGVSSMRKLAKYMDLDKNGEINRAEYESDDKTITAIRMGTLKNSAFSKYDANNDSCITTKDFGLLSEKFTKSVLDAYTRKDDDWIWNNYFHVTSAWMREHASLEANKTRMMRIDIPVYIFHGEEDANCDVEWVYNLAQNFKEAGKNNLQYFVFKEHDHNLLFDLWVVRKEVSEGIKKIFEVAGELNK